MSTTFAPGNQKECNTCGSLMPTKAIKCIACETLQVEQKYCVVCGSLVPASSEKCSICESMQGDQKRCVVCAASIPKVASRCTVCSSFQDWRRHLVVGPASTTMVALLTALISVMAASSVPIQHLVNGYDSKMSVSFTGDDHSGGIILVGFNSGDRPGAVTQVDLTIPFKSGPFVAHGVYDPKVGDGDGIVGVATGKKLRITFPDVKFDSSRLSTDPVTDKCAFSVTIKEFSGQSRPVSFADVCGNLSVVVGPPHEPS